MRAQEARLAEYSQAVKEPEGSVIDSLADMMASAWQPKRYGKGYLDYVYAVTHFEVRPPPSKGAHQFVCHPPAGRWT